MHIYCFQSAVKHRQLSYFNLTGECPMYPSDTLTSDYFNKIILFLNNWKISLKWTIVKHTSTSNYQLKHIH